jgi:hypothetical protein
MLGDAGRWPTFGAAFVGALVFYLGVHRLLGWRPLAAEPWLATLVTLLPLGLLFAYPDLPEGVRAGVSSYVGASLVVNAAIAYGGCEVLAAPILLFRRRPTVYCPYNAIDAVERSMTHRVHDRGWLLLAVLAVGAGIYLLLVGPLLSWDGSERVRQVVVLLLLLPTLALGWRTMRLHRSGARAEARIAAVGAFALLGVIVVLAGLAPQDLMWGVIMLGGAIFALVRLLRRRGQPADLH